MRFYHMLLLSLSVLAAVFGLCRFLIWRWENYENTRDDERQVEAQGRAGKTAFVFLSVYLSVALLLRHLELEMTPTDYYSVLWLGVLLGIAVYATITIWMDAYAGLRSRWKTVVVCLLVLSGLNLFDMLDGVMSLSGPFVHVSIWLKIAVGAICLYLALLVFIHMKINERD